MSDPQDATRSLATLIDASPTPFHAVTEAARRLEEGGFTRLREEDRWSLAAGGKHYVVRNGSSLVAFVVGSQAPAEAGFRLVGAHTDSPNLRLKPHPATAKEGYLQLGVEVYGGALLATWFDRDLSLAGRVFFEGEAEPRLLNLERPVCRIPHLAIHLDPEVNEKGFKINRQTQLPPVLGLSDPAREPGWFDDLLRAELGVDRPVLAFELMLHDVVPSCVSGLEGEFLHAPRLDNLASCHAALTALRSSAERGPAERTWGVALYDHEEVGSASAEGADSPFLQAILERITRAMGGSFEDTHRALARSLFVSADMAHAVHPNYSDRHEPQHLPRMNAGPVIKINANQRYATNAATAAAFARYAQEVDVPVQRFVTRTDLRCGSTIGPITASRLGIPTVDVGNPMLSMHSIREMCGTRDQDSMIRVLERHFS